MCDDCGKVFRGWFKSFTKTEIWLSLLEAFFLVVLITFLIFLILHLNACYISKHTDPTTAKSKLESVDSEPDLLTTPYSETSVTKDRGKCTWTPSHKTKAVTHYYLNETNIIQTTPNFKKVDLFIKAKFDLKNVLSFENPNGDAADNITKDFVVALVKIKSNSDIIFGCTLSIISEYWTVTSASCIESAAEVDSLSNFVMMDGYKEESERRIHDISEVIMHPTYQSINTSYDLCALKSEDRLIGKSKDFLTLPTPLDYFVTAMGDRLTILGFGKYRSIDTEPLARDVRAVSVHVFPWERCGRHDTWAIRYLEEGAGRTGKSSNKMHEVCAGAVGGAGGACRYCAGTPLLRGRTLLAVMGDWRGCALDCGPAPYVNLVPHVSWLHSLDNSP